MVNLDLSRISRIIVLICYGYEVPDLQDPLVSVMIQTMVDFGKASAPGAFLVDAIPMRLSFYFSVKQNHLVLCSPIYSSMVPRS